MELAEAVRTFNTPHLATFFMRSRCLGHGDTETLAWFNNHPGVHVSSSEYNDYLDATNAYLAANPDEEV